MYASAVILFGLLAIPQVLGLRADPFRTDFDFTKSRRSIDRNFGFTKLRGGIDPEIIKRHVYVFSEFCPGVTRFMEFGDEVMVASQRPWDKSYATNRTCVMHIDRPPNTGIIYTVLKEDTPDCLDYLKVTVMNEPKPANFCGPESNITGSATTTYNTSIILEWRAIDRRETSEHFGGFMILMTAFQYKCHRGQACFPCVNGLVIDQMHMCNGYDNCGDGSDETNCPPDPPAPTRKPHVLPPESRAVVGLSITISALVAVVIFLGAMWWRSSRGKTHNQLENTSSP